MLDGTPGTRLHGNPIYLGPLMGPFHASVVSAVIGATWAAAEEYEAVIRSMKNPA
jgi:3-hydroxy-9,10-secoandrosta-1,3,5(10)-triene-9,17-dione monooxygenase